MLVLCSWVFEVSSTELRSPTVVARVSTEGNFFGASRDIVTEATGMVFRPESVEDWFHFVPTLLENDGWQIASECPAGRLLHRKSPWGGHLIRFSLRDILVHERPADPSYLFLRPEVRDWARRSYPELNEESFEVVQQLAPGDAVVKREVAWRFNRQCNLFFCSLSGKAVSSNNLLFQTTLEKPGQVRQMVRRNYPQQGDSVILVQCLSALLEAVVVGRPQGPNTFALDMVMKVPSVLPLWASMHFEKLLVSARDLTEWFVNRPGITEMRQRDQQFYVILTIQSWRRGRPLLPATAAEVAAEQDVTTIDAGKREGLTSWVRYHPAMVGSSSFVLSEYLSVFLTRIGEQASFYQSLDGQELLPYQCAIQREDWDRVKGRFHCAYALQKAAYRRSRGGATAPSVQDSLGPRFRDDRSLDVLQQRLTEATEVKTVVRKTFIDVDEPTELESQTCQQRCRTLSPVSHLCGQDFVDVR